MPTIYKIGKTWFLNYSTDGKHIRKVIRRKADAELAQKDIEVMGLFELSK